MSAEGNNATPPPPVVPPLVGLGAASPEPTVGSPTSPKTASRTGSARSRASMSSRSGSPNPDVAPVLRLGTPRTPRPTGTDGDQQRGNPNAGRDDASYQFATNPTGSAPSSLHPSALQAQSSETYSAVAQALTGGASGQCEDEDALRIPGDSDDEDEESGVITSHFVPTRYTLMFAIEFILRLLFAPLFILIETGRAVHRLFPNDRKPLLTVLFLFCLCFAYMIALAATPKTAEFSVSLIELTETATNTSTAGAQRQAAAPNAVVPVLLILHSPQPPVPHWAHIILVVLAALGVLFLAVRVLQRLSHRPSGLVVRNAHATKRPLYFIFTLFIWSWEHLQLALFPLLFVTVSRGRETLTGFGAWVDAKGVRHMVANWICLTGFAPGDGNGGTEQWASADKTIGLRGYRGDADATSFPVFYALLWPLIVVCLYWFFTSLSAFFQGNSTAVKLSRLHLPVRFGSMSARTLQQKSRRQHSALMHRTVLEQSLYNNARVTSADGDRSGAVEDEGVAPSFVATLLGSGSYATPSWFLPPSFYKGFLVLHQEIFSLQGPFALGLMLFVGQFLVWWYRTIPPIYAVDALIASGGTVAGTTLEEHDKPPLGLHEFRTVGIFFALLTLSIGYFIPALVAPVTFNGDSDVTVPPFYRGLRGVLKGFFVGLCGFIAHVGGASTTNDSVVRSIVIAVVALGYHALQVVLVLVFKPHPRVAFNGVAILSHFLGFIVGIACLLLSGSTDSGAAGVGSGALLCIFGGIGLALIVFAIVKTTALRKVLPYDEQSRAAGVRKEAVSGLRLYCSATLLTNSDGTPDEGEGDSEGKMSLRMFFSPFDGKWRHFIPTVLWRPLEPLLELCHSASTVQTQFLAQLLLSSSTPKGILSGDASWHLTFLCSVESLSRRTSPRQLVGLLALVRRIFFQPTNLRFQGGDLEVQKQLFITMSCMYTKLTAAGWYRFLVQSDNAPLVTGGLTLTPILALEAKRTKAPAARSTAETEVLDPGHYFRTIAVEGRDITFAAGESEAEANEREAGNQTVADALLYNWRSLLGTTVAHDLPDCSCSDAVVIAEACAGYATVVRLHVKAYSNMLISLFQEPSPRLRRESLAFNIDVRASTVSPFLPEGGGPLSANQLSSVRLLANQFLAHSSMVESVATLYLALLNIAPHANQASSLACRESIANVRYTVLSTLSDLLDVVAVTEEMMRTSQTPEPILQELRSYIPAVFPVPGLHTNALALLRELAGTGHDRFKA